VSSVVVFGKPADEADDPSEVAVKRETQRMQWRESKRRSRARKRMRSGPSRRSPQERHPRAGHE
jgi:hypothetical protein